MPKRVLIVDNAVHRFLFKPPWHWKAHLKGVDIKVVNLPAGHRVPSLDRFTHLILTGSEASIVEPKPWFDVEAKLIRDAVAIGIPTLASCFGHQMLVYALSGPEYLRRSCPPEVGWADIEMIEEDPLFEGVANPWRTFVYHFDEVSAPPPPWRVLGKSNVCPVHVIRYGNHQVWGIQPHPEMSSRKAILFMRFTLLLGRKPSRHILRAIRNVPPRNDVAEIVVRRFLAMEHQASSFA